MFCRKLPFPLSVLSLLLLLVIGTHPGGRPEAERDSCCCAEPSHGEHCCALPLICTSLLDEVRSYSVISASVLLVAATRQGSVMSTRVFDTYVGSIEDVLVTFLNSVMDGRIICFAIMVSPGKTVDTSQVLTLATSLLHHSSGSVSLGGGGGGGSIPLRGGQYPLIVYWAKSIFQYTNSVRDV